MHVVNPHLTLTPPHLTKPQISTNMRNEEIARSYIIAESAGLTSADSIGKMRNELQSKVKLTWSYNVDDTTSTQFVQAQDPRLVSVAAGTTSNATSAMITSYYDSSETTSTIHVDDVPVPGYIHFKTFLTENRRLNDMTQVIDVVTGQLLSDSIIVDSPSGKSRLNERITGTVHSQLHYDFGDGLKMSAFQVKDLADDNTLSWGTSSEQYSTTYGEKHISIVIQNDPGTSMRTVALTVSLPRYKVEDLMALVTPSSFLYLICRRQIRFFFPVVQ